MKNHRFEIRWTSTGECLSSEPYRAAIMQNGQKCFLCFGSDDLQEVFAACVATSDWMETTPGLVPTNKYFNRRDGIEVWHLLICQKCLLDGLEEYLRLERMKEMKRMWQMPLWALGAFLGSAIAAVIAWSQEGPLVFLLSRTWRVYPFWGQPDILGIDDKLISVYPGESAARQCLRMNQPAASQRTDFHGRISCSESLLQYF